MNCLSLDQVYLFLEGELTPEEISGITGHTATCEKCRNAVEDRRILMEAAESLPRLQVPSDVTQQVMARIFPQKSQIRLWIATLATGFSLVVAIFLAAFLQSNLSFSGTFIQLNRSLWGFVSNLSVFFIKLIKIISLAFNLLVQLSSYIYKALTSMTSVIGIEVQITLVVLTILLSVTAFYGVRRKIWSGENI
jgi:hypothetical protein